MRVSALLEFFEPSIGVDWNLQPTQAFEYLRAKGLRATFSYADMLGEEHAAAFTVAKMLDTDLLADVKASLEDALDTGKAYRQWADELVPLLQSKGWWGRAPVVDPLTGQTVVAQLGSPSRLQTIFRTNMQSAYSVGHWEQIAEQQDEAPFLMYDAIDDYRTRPEHAALDGKIHAVGSAFWEHYYPPNGWNCRCSAIQLSADELDELGLEPSGPFRLQTREWKNPRTGKIERVADGVDPGFDFNPGQKRLDALSNLAIEKVKALPPDTRPAAQQKLDAPEPPIAPAPRPRFNNTTSGKWHTASFEDAPDWVRNVIAAQADVGVQYRSKGAWAKAGSLIEMGRGKAKALGDRFQQGIWRHEFGHIVDFRVGTGFPRRSSEDDFKRALNDDEAEILTRSGKTPGLRAQFLAGQYEAARNEVIDTEQPDRVGLLQRMAAAASVDFDEFMALVREDLTVLDAAGPESVGAAARVASMLKALELGDAEGFVRFAVGVGDAALSARDRLAGWNKEGSVALLADLIGAVTRNGACRYAGGYYGHSDSYYRKTPGGRGTEAFANLTALAGVKRRLWWEIASRLVPQSARKFKEIMEGL